jgi:hypothetical protein
MPPSDAELEFGRALCDRLGLDPMRVLRGYHLEPLTGTAGGALVTVEVMQVLTADELRELQAIAKGRAAANALAATLNNNYGGTP